MGQQETAAPKGHQRTADRPVVGVQVPENAPGLMSLDFAPKTARRGQKSPVPVNFSGTERALNGYWPETPHGASFRTCASSLAVIPHAPNDPKKRGYATAIFRFFGYWDWVLEHFQPVFVAKT